MFPSDRYSRNQLLAALPGKALDFLVPHLEASILKQDELIFEAGQIAVRAVFPGDCVLSVVTIMADGRSAETASIGREGCVGFVSGLGDRHVIDRCIVQMDGSATSVPLVWLNRAVERFPAVRDLQMRYFKAVFAHTLRSVACSSLHTIDLRCARWLLMAHDRVQRDTFSIKQDDLAKMLGVRRSSVGQVCGELQRVGIIRYSRGSITILDRARLEAAACECYGAVQRIYQRVLPKRRRIERG